jgi:hypothetical protein
MYIWNKKQAWKSEVMHPLYQNQNLDYIPILKEDSDPPY